MDISQSWDSGKIHGVLSDVNYSLHEINQIWCPWARASYVTSRRSLESCAVSRLGAHSISIEDRIRQQLCERLLRRLDSWLGVEFQWIQSRGHRYTPCVLSWTLHVRHLPAFINIRTSVEHESWGLVKLLFYSTFHSQCRSKYHREFWQFSVLLKRY
jgi:hypothetical protein